MSSKRGDYFTANKIDHIDYKDTKLLRKFLTQHGRIQPRKKTGARAENQRALARAVKRARYMGLLPYVIR
jgi:small subunit ribosomal protein S18